MSLRSIYIFAAMLFAALSLASFVPSDAHAWRALKVDAQRIANSTNSHECGGGGFWRGCVDATAPGAFSKGACQPYGNHSWLCRTGMIESNIFGGHRFCATTVHVFHLGALHYRKCGKLLW